MGRRTDCGGAVEETEDLQCGRRYEGGAAAAQGKLACLGEDSFSKVVNSGKLETAAKCYLVFNS